MKKLFGSVFVPGGAGYVGSALVGRLLDAGYRVTVLDLFLYDESALDAVRHHPNLVILRGDVRDTSAVRRAMQGAEAVIHLACISNDPSFELDPVLSRSINYDSFLPLVKIAKENKVRRFIFASSSSVYGVSDAPEVTEEHPHLPVTDYNKYKSMCESVLWSQRQKGFVPVSIRPATLCGYAPRLRLDLTVNIFTNQAVNGDRLTVFGGSQMRPNLHVDDMVDLYLQLLTVPDDLIDGQAYNVAYENHRVADLAETVRRVVGRRIPAKKDLPLIVSPSDDTRSYHICSQKIKTRLGFVPKRSIEDAIDGLVDAFLAGKAPNSMTDVKYFNVKKLMNTDLMHGAGRIYGQP